VLTGYYKVIDSIARTTRPGAVPGRDVSTVDDRGEIRSSRDVAQLFQLCEQTRQHSLFLQYVAGEARQRARAWRLDEPPGVEDEARWPDPDRLIHGL
jgi:hypothetical protein